LPISVNACTEKLHQFVTDKRRIAAEKTADSMLFVLADKVWPRHAHVVPHRPER